MPRFLEKSKDFFTPSAIFCRFLTGWAVYTAIRSYDNRGFIDLRWGQHIFTPVFAIFLLGAFLFLSLFICLTRQKWIDVFALWLSIGVCVTEWGLQSSAVGEANYFRLALVVLFSLATVWMLSFLLPVLQKIRLSGVAVWTFASIAAIGACTILSVITCLRYLTFSSPNYDFGIFVNMFHYLKKTGFPLDTSERDGLISHFAVHASPIFYLLLPFYAVFPSPLTLQIGQSVVLLLGVIPLILLCRHYRLSEKVTAAFALIYCFYPVLSTGCFYDIHENCFLTFFLLLTFYFFEKEKTLPLFLSALCVLATKEDAAVYLLIFAVYAFFEPRRRRTGIALALLSGTYFLIVTNLIKRFGTGLLSTRFNNLIAAGDGGIGGILKTFLGNPGYVLTQLFSAADGNWGKIWYLLVLLLPLGFLPFCSQKPTRWLLLAPVLINIMTTDRYIYDIGFQYSFGVTACFFYAAIRNFSSLHPKARRPLLGIALASCFVLYLTLVVPAFDYYTHAYENNAEIYAQMEETLDKIPENASVTCSTFLLPHLADRDAIYEIEYHPVEADADYIVIDIRYNSGYVIPYRSIGYSVSELSNGNILVLAK